MIEILLLDIDDTLLDFSWAEDQAIHRTYRELGAEMTDEMYARYHVVNQLWWQAYERGEIDRESLLSARHRQMCEEYGLGFDPVRNRAKFLSRPYITYIHSVNRYGELCGHQIEGYYSGADKRKRHHGDKPVLQRG